MTLTLNTEHERIINEELRAGRFGSAEEVIARIAGPATDRDQHLPAKARFQAGCGPHSGAPESS